MNITTEIVSVCVKDRPWDGPQGLIWFVEGTFQDGSQFSVGSKSDGKAQEKKAALEQIKGQQATFEVEHKGEYQGRPKYKLLSWPGKEGSAPAEKQTGPFQSHRAAGGSGYSQAYANGEEAFHLKQDAIARSVALQQAVDWFGRVRAERAMAGAGGPQEPPVPAESLLSYADVFYAWLVQPPPVPNPTPQASSEKSIALLASESISACIANKNLDQLQKVQARIAERYSQKAITDEELTLLEQELSQAKKLIAPAVELDAWARTKQQEALKRDPGLPGKQTQPDPLQEARDRF